MKNKPIINTSDIQWRDNNAPYSGRFNDIYYMPDVGLDEARHVFVAANNLSQRWSQLSPDDEFDIFECGFGTGLNFMATINEWQEAACSGKLVYTAFEGYPLTAEQLSKALAVYEDKLPLVQQLIDQYPQVLDGHTIAMTENVSLQLIVCQAENLAECITASHAYDVVFMDGFSPANNPEMWSLSLCQQLYTMTKDSATLSTFTVAGQVKRHLKQAGFDIKKVPGFGKKREMLTATKC